MAELVSTITSKGQVTLPVKVRRHLGVTNRDKVEFVIGEDGVVRVQPVAYPTIASLRGVAGKLPRPMSWSEMIEIAHEDHIAERGKAKQ